WSTDKETLRIIFLVGDAPPHMDYKDDVKYPDSCKLAGEKGILINTVQCGGGAEGARVWQDISSKAGGADVENCPEAGQGRGVTPHDKRLAEINAELENSTLVYGSKEKQQKDQEFRLKSLDGAKAEPGKPGDPKGAAPPAVKVEAPKGDATAKAGTVVPTTG